MTERKTSPRQQAKRLFGEVMALQTRVAALEARKAAYIKDYDAKIGKAKDELNAARERYKALSEELGL